MTERLPFPRDVLDIEDDEALQYDVQGPLTLDQFWEMSETATRQELVHGWMVREPAPVYGHQRSIVLLGSALEAWCVKNPVGVVLLAPFDVILDVDKQLIVQPDVMFVRNDRRHQIQDWLWGAPNIAIEVLSPSTARRDRQLKREWYRKYGVEEYWLVDPERSQIEIIDFTTSSCPAATFEETDLLQSKALPGFSAPVQQFFDDTVTRKSTVRRDSTRHAATPEPKSGRTDDGHQPR